MSDIDMMIMHNGCTHKPNGFDGACSDCILGYMRKLAKANRRLFDAAADLVAHESRGEQSGDSRWLTELYGAVHESPYLSGWDGLSTRRAK